MASSEPWMYGPITGFGDSWFSGALARETEAVLTKALQKSLFNPSSAEPISHSPLAKTETGSVSGSGSDPETLGLKRRNGVAVGKITKRKSRASKRSTTTFITADPANFRQMVQQVTGVKFGNGQMPVAAAPPPHTAGMLPTLDTSACLLDHRPSSLVADGGAGFDFHSFPTLESWN